MDRIYKISTNYDVLLKGEKIIGYIVLRDNIIIGCDDYALYVGHLADKVKKYMIEVRLGKKRPYIKHIYETKIVRNGQIVTNEILDEPSGKSVLTLISPGKQYELYPEIMFKVRYFIRNNEIIINDIPKDILRMIGLR